ncbi:MAG: hypothetical protein OXC92_05690 [Flavobacteriaceae bacterium]|nr:hypothetical protein [Flavobacteriaceae bacterium]MCY4216458.1 hypothetical protein [Flavobacteriaceae bacterium]MCY4253955.1 hypothetical protein [Flavobacteriaceae bacterium]
MTLKFKLIFSLILVSIFTIGCKKENKVEPPRDPAEQIIADQLALEKYLNTHFYNYEDFVDDSQNFNLSVKIDTIMGENATKTPLIDQVQSKKIQYRHRNNQEIIYDYYYIILREGVGSNPHIVDSAFVAYKGELLTRSQFDTRLTPIWMDLTRVIRGFGEGISLLKTGDYKINEDNTVEFFDFGQGIFFFPSGLGYYSNSSPGIPEYSPLVFQVSLYTLKETDHDGDGVLSKDEYDRDLDGVPDDSDEDGIPDYLDAT